MSIYVGEYGVYQLPADDVVMAQTMNGDKKLTDQRTRGARYLVRVGKDIDATHEAVIVLSKASE